MAENSQMCSPEFPKSQGEILTFFILSNQEKIFYIHQKEAEKAKKSANLINYQNYCQLID